MILFNTGWGDCPFGLTNNIQRINTAKELYKTKEPSYLLLHGGEDISPSIYREKNSKYCNAPSAPSKRDQIEMDLITTAVNLGIPIVGICRGAQLLCAMDGGSLVQHIMEHTSENHQLRDSRFGDVIGDTNTAHHQMMIPRQTNNNVVLAEVSESVFGYTQDDKLRAYKRVPEIVLFKGMNAIGIQFHPEWMNPNQPAIKYCTNAIKTYLLKGQA